MHVKLGGVLLFLVILLVMLSPLLLFSSANPNQALNNVIGVTTRVLIEDTQAEFELLSISSITLSEVTDNDVALLREVGTINTAHRLHPS